ncbi:2-oxo-4-hydroxy-4-carboxy-5-ureidoimidazoline decarboxylase [Arthrobacter sp. Helios]|uniref:2-oxo-4-hydroxy-4-carboxy-5-ureidoimidazoline decarboxylase n=1 Tax=Arthrobacter sp. Helios TaxID=2828862 RepID=UPI002055F817|nr:2-oxo-4-hydroxy-4-carboxy-5-ureidoimidazoline decarboxylase [Arthrobacter sp. Helios]UPO75877.1 2-oxo-4-hydroxy-4-carboxy-5-ureidoimidazoline decarboxylase [Arthrobacter sp. Helios]
MLLHDFNEASRAEVTAALLPCLDVPRWAAQIADARPFASTGDLLRFAGDAAAPLSSREVEAALARHPRIGERAAGENAEAQWSRQEQAGLGTAPETVIAALAEGNRRYEEKFGRVFLIRAAGRTKEEVLEALRERINLSAAEEEHIVQQQLRQIAVHRLEGMISQ